MAAMTARTREAAIIGQEGSVRAPIVGVISPNWVSTAMGVHFEERYFMDPEYRICGADFGGQNGPLISVRTCPELFSPYYGEINSVIDSLTGWKTFKHCDGRIYDLIPVFIAGGFDILNPIPTSTARMDPRTLKREFGGQLIVWGGGVETQSTIPFGTPDEVSREVRERIDIFNDGAGYVFAAICNIQPNTPVANLLALIEAVRESRISDDARAQATHAQPRP
jgi:hypothetical protein